MRRQAEGKGLPYHTLHFQNTGVQQSVGPFVCEGLLLSSVLAGKHGCPSILCDCL